MSSVRAAFRLFLIFALLIAPLRSAIALTESEREHLRMMTEWFPYSACQDNKYLKQCFLWSTDECEGTTELSASSCLKMYQSQWMSPSSGSFDKWQDKLINCVQRDIQAKLKKRAIASMMCKNKGGQ